MVRSRYLALATGMAVVLIAGGPIALQARLAIGAAFPESFGTIVRAGVTIIIGTAMLIALARIWRPGRGQRVDRTPDQRRLRYGTLVGALAAGLVFARALRTGNSAIDVVEAFHFVEYGLLACLFYAAWLPLGDGSVVILPLLCGLLVGTLDEWVQWFVPFRVGEIRDVVLNLVAVGCGLLFGIALEPPPLMTFRLRRDSIPRMCGMLAVVTLVLASFFQSVHLGHDVRDGEIGTFRSRYTREELADAGAVRLERWRRDPPLAPGRFSREDQYLSEALWHLRRRNEADRAGDIPTAWRENRIIEIFFEPVLDTPNYVSRSGFRWSAVQRANAAAQVRPDAAIDPRPAEPYPLYPWPRMTFWGVIALLIAAAGVVCLSSERSRHGGQADS
jgi:VanZ family protein